MASSISLLFSLDHQFIPLCALTSIPLTDCSTVATAFTCGLQILNNYTPSAVGYKVIDSQRCAQHRVGSNNLVSDKREWNNWD